jgi:membrane associated rhomboid family serine protease
MLFDSLADDLRYQLRHGDAVIRLIIAHTTVFIVMGLLSLISYLAQSNGVWTVLDRGLQLPAHLPSLLYQPWSLLTYMFYHYALGHFFFNMLTLYWFGQIFTTYMDERRIIPLYLLGGIAGGVLYVIVYNLLPVFAPVLVESRLAGASAGILAVMCAAATFNPDHEVQLILVGRVAIKYVVVGMLLLDLVSIPQHNAGGYIAHLGGAILGYIYVILLRRGTDITSPIANIPKLWQPKSKLKASYTNSNLTNRSTSNKPTDQTQARLDEILDKINRSGYSSLSKDEKEFLFKYSTKE